jgi:hypothetical protein
MLAGSYCWPPAGTQPEHQRLLLPCAGAFALLLPLLLLLMLAVLLASWQQQVAWQLQAALLS